MVTEKYMFWLKAKIVFENLIGFFSFPLSSGEDDDSYAPHDVSARDSEDEAEWDRLQAEVRTRDAILDPKSKESHIVHAPYFPEVWLELNFVSS